MRFPHFGQRGRPDGDGDERASPDEWRYSGLADEVEAFLAGRYVDHLATRRQPVPPWAVINRLAHADRTELVNLVAGMGPDGIPVPRAVQPQWEESERFVAAHLLATSGSPEAIRRVQRTTLIPLELALIERVKTERLTAEQVLEAGAAALGGDRPGR